jgi:hypothetical protein
LTIFGTDNNGEKTIVNSGNMYLTQTKPENGVFIFFIKTSTYNVFLNAMLAFIYITMGNLA